MCQAGPLGRVSDRTVVRAVRPHVHFIKSGPISTTQVRNTMADNKTDASIAPRSGDPANPTMGGLSAKTHTASHSAGAEPGLDTRFHRTFQGADVARPGAA